MKKLFRSADRRLAGAAVVSGLLLAPLGIFGSSALAHTASPSAAQYQYKVTICHRTHSKKHPWVQITISNRALKAHLKHGDKFPPPCPTTAQSTKAKHHGKPSSTGATTQTTSNNENHGNANGKSKEHENASSNASTNSQGHSNNGHHGKS